MKLFLILFSIISSTFFITNVDIFSLKKKTTTTVLMQDNTVLVKKIKARISALKKQRKKLKNLKKWSSVKEKSYVEEIKKLEAGLKKLGYKESNNLSVEEKIKKLQKELKYINNNRVNKNAKNSWTKEDDAIYEKKASKLIDSIIKLRKMLN
ncbi:hypothetical protein FDT66_13295 [Polaribacter aestuariivivens]|uniref:Uncharacterized protein n=1 Tax=Polaribacter aestuariivivens TaxID=2304626 RepID=A0A5S3N338_9FLAO|nr:hypothetical protein [Polaribacter aestuariivivens]TMM28874.1 hypothetical protein FDT66_13295 [Polaribacter aestuariivivens]